MSYHANISMVKYLVGEILPKVWAKRPGVRLLIVGKDPTADVRALGSDSRITVTGTVDDIRPYLWKATCAVVPLVYGAGIQNKILEAMACGTAVITTSKTLSSLQVAEDRELLVADRADGFAEKVLNLLDDWHLQMRIGAAGSNYVNEHHNWTAITNQLLLYYTGTLQAFVDAR
jgi:glycosyltransferase involved in cell wall biosynthesis